MNATGNHAVPCAACESTGQRVAIVDPVLTDDGVKRTPDTCAVVDCLDCRVARRELAEANRE